MGLRRVSTAASRAHVGILSATVVMPRRRTVDGEPVGLEMVRKASKAGLARAVVHQIGAILMFAALPSPYTHPYTGCAPPARCDLQVALLVDGETTGACGLSVFLF